MTLMLVHTHISKMLVSRYLLFEEKQRETKFFGILIQIFCSNCNNCFEFRGPNLDYSFLVSEREILLASGLINEDPIINE